MKVLLTMVLGLFTMSAFADKLTEKKDMMNEHLDKKITRLQAAKSCIQEAKTEDALKACKTDMKDDMKEMKAEFKDKKKEMKKQSEEEAPVDELPEEDE